jgi:uncharacterized protein (DUF1810 family)
MSSVMCSTSLRSGYQRHRDTRTAPGTIDLDPRFAVHFRRDAWDHLMTDIDLQRFVEAQVGNYPAALSELRAGRKRTHWMWYVFPQIAGLGHSAMAQRYAIASRAEADAYLAHDVLGPRLRDCTQAVLAVPDKTANAILGSPDDIKFRSSMTLFDAVAPLDIFGAALARFFRGQRDPATLDRL